MPLEPRKPDPNANRKMTLIRLIKIRKEVEDAINALSGDPEHREFVKKHEAGFQPNVRELRNYDVELEDPEAVAARFGVNLEQTS